MKFHGRMKVPGLPTFAEMSSECFKMLIQVLYYENVEKCIFPPQKDYMKEISQLLVHTLKEIRARKVERTKEREREKGNTDKMRQNSAIDWGVD